MFQFQKVVHVKDTLRFEILAHNTHKTEYQCLFVTATEKSVLMDDEAGGEYKGATLAFQRGLNNKLAINQKKTFTLTIPAPHREVNVVNLHFGLYSQNIRPVQDCGDPRANEGYNFHQLDVDLSPIK